MSIIRSNAIRIKRFRELKETLRTNRNRLLVGIDIAKAAHVAQVRLAHTQLVDKQLTIPNTQVGFERFWAHLESRRAETGLTELVCAVEPTGTYHEALAQFLERQGADVVLVSTTVAHHNRRTLDGTWGKSDPKDAHNLCDLLERGHVLCSSLPDGPLADLRRLVRLVRQARTELAACKARFRNTLLPRLGPAGEPPPPALVATLPGPLRVLVPKPAPTPRPRRCAASRLACATPGDPGLPAGAWEYTDLAARLTAVQARITQLEVALVQVATPLPAYGWLLSLPGIGPTLAAILLAEIGDIGWDHEVLPTSQTRGAGHHRSGLGEVDRHDADFQVRPAAPALGALPSSDGGVPESGVACPAGGLDRQAAGRSVRLPQGEHRAGGEAPAPRLGGVAEWAAV